MRGPGLSFATAATERAARGLRRQASGWCQHALIDSADYIAGARADARIGRIALDHLPQALPGWSALTLERPAGQTSHAQLGPRLEFALAPMPEQLDREHAAFAVPVRSGPR